jgi:HD superfamily phosphodiesterase
MENNLNTRLQEISKFSRKYQNSSYKKRSTRDKAHLHKYLSGTEYRWKHTLRVAQFGKVIAENEGAEVELVLAACLLHDMAWFDAELIQPRTWAH